MRGVKARVEEEERGEKARDGGREMELDGKEEGWEEKE